MMMIMTHGLLFTKGHVDHSLVRDEHNNKIIIIRRIYHNNNEYKNNKCIHNLEIRGREIRKCKIYKSVGVSTSMDGRMEGIHRVGQEFIKYLKCMEVLLEFQEIRRGIFW